MSENVELRKDKNWTRLRFTTSGAHATLDVRDLNKTAKVGEFFHGGMYFLSPTEALVLAAALTRWAEKQKAVQSAARARRRATR